MSPMPPPPWSVAGTTVDLVRDNEKRELHIVVPPGCMTLINDDQLLELMTFIEATRERFARVLPPGWKVVA